MPTQPASSKGLKISEVLLKATICNTRCKHANEFREAGGQDELEAPQTPPRQRANSMRQELCIQKQ